MAKLPPTHDGSSVYTYPTNNYYTSGIYANKQNKIIPVSGIQGEGYLPDTPVTPQNINYLINKNGTYVSSLVDGYLDDRDNIYRLRSKQQEIALGMITPTNSVPDGYYINNQYLRFDYINYVGKNIVYGIFSGGGVYAQPYGAGYDPSIGASVAQGIYRIKVQLDCTSTSTAVTSAVRIAIRVAPNTDTYQTIGSAIGYRQSTDNTHVFRVTGEALYKHTGEALPRIAFRVENLGSGEQMSINYSNYPRIFISHFRENGSIRETGV